MTAETRTPERIVCAAIKHADGSIICGARHFDEIMVQQIMDTNKDWRQAEQGFINQYGEFICREEAYDIAKERGQILHDLPHTVGTLYSEHLY